MAQEPLQWALSGKRAEKNQHACLASQRQDAYMASLDHKCEGAITISHFCVLGGTIALAKAELEKQFVP